MMTNDGSGALNQAADRIEAWFADAWPLWIEHGLDANGLFYEQLDHHGRPDDSVPRRTRVQARQLYAFSRAWAAGHRNADAPLGRALDAFEAHCGHPDGGWVHKLTVDGQTHDSTVDLYDQAFVLFGLHGAQQAGFDRARRLADGTLAFIDARLTDPVAGGYFEGLPDTLPRRSNPHMHLLEAMLAWYAISGEADFLDRANRIASLFAGRFFDPERGTLGEFFDRHLRLLPPPQGDAVETGHHLEWSWLLHRLADAGGLDKRREARALHEWALRYGLDETRFAIDECDRSGAQIRRSRRAWPQTELIKSYLANGQPDDAARVTMAFFDSYLATPVRGLWIDRFKPGAEPVHEPVPASTLYHIVVAFEDVLRAAGRFD